MREIVAQNVGPSEVVRIPVPDGGGVVVLRGQNGAGKTKLLEAIDSATTKRGQVAVRDGQERAEVEAFGIRMTVGRSARRKGELEVQTLEGRMSLGELIDPGLLDPVAADARRIKALVQLCGVKPARELFAPLVGGMARLNKVAPDPFGEEFSDLVSMAEHMKRAFEQEARRLEGQAEKFRATSTSLKEQAGQIRVTTTLSSQQALQQLREAAVLERQTAERLTAYRQAVQKHDVITNLLVEAEQQASQLPTVLEAEQNLAQTISRQEGLESCLTLARNEVIKLERLYGESVVKVGGYREELLVIRQLSSALANLRECLAAPLPERVGQEDVVAASSQLAGAEREVGAAEEREQHCRFVADSIQFGEQAGGLERRGLEMRDAAAGCEQILSGMVAGLASGLRVEHGRLVLDTDRGTEPFGELSVGERTPIALRIGCGVLGRGGLVVLPQELWEGLDPLNRQVVRDLARQHDTVVVTAQCSDQEGVVAEVMA